MGKKGKGTKKFTTSCDDGMFMSSEIEVEYQKSDNLAGISMEIKYQCGYGPAYLRLSEIEELIKVLKDCANMIRQDYPEKSR